MCAAEVGGGHSPNRTSEQQYRADVSGERQLDESEDPPFLRAIELAKEAKRLLDSHAEAGSSPDNAIELEEQIELGAQAKKALILGGLSFAIWAARRFAGNAPQATFLEKIQAANYGWIGAVNAFDSEKGEKLRAAAMGRIRSELQELGARSGSLFGFSKSQDQRAKHVAKWEALLTEQDGRPPTDEELTAAYQNGRVSEEKVVALRRIAHYGSFSLDTPVRNDEGALPYSDTLADSRSSDEFDEAIEQIDQRAKVIKILGLLQDPSDRLVLSLIYGVALDEFIGQTVQIGRKGSKFSYDQVLAEARRGKDQLTNEQLANLTGLSSSGISKRKLAAFQKIRDDSEE